MKDITNIVYIDKQLKRGEKQELKGNFDSKYANLSDYIIDITYDIWEAKGIGVLYDTYGENMSLHSGLKTVHGRDGVISSTLDTQQTFPDRALFGEEVIWSEAKNDSYLSSHRLGCTAVHTSYSNMYGTPTGKKIFYRVMADCLVKDNFIIEEWIVRDLCQMYQALGMDPIKIAKKSKRYKGMPEGEDFRELQEVNEIGRIEVTHQDFKPTGDASVDLIADMYRVLHKQNRFDKVEDYYHRTALLNSICEKRYNGRKQVQNYYIDFFASVPNSDIIIDRITCDKGAYVDKVAVRWTIKGTHQNYGEFGKPSGKKIQIVGITHYEIADGKITQEWVVFDKFDVLCQIYADRD